MISWGIGILSTYSNKGVFANDPEKWDDVSGVSLKLPKRSDSQGFALVTLNVPAFTAFGLWSNRSVDYPGGQLGISIDDKMHETIAEFSSGFRSVHSAGATSATLIVGIELKADAEQQVKAVVRRIHPQSSVHAPGASLSAIIGARRT